MIRQAAIVATSVMLVGCSSGGADDATLSADAVRAPLTAKQVATRFGYTGKSGYSPLLELVPGYQSSIDGYARDLRARECLKGQIQVTAVPPEKFNGVDPRTLRTVFTEGFANKYGFIPPQQYPLQVELNHDPAFDSLKVGTACGRATDKVLRMPKTPFIIGLNSATYDAIRDRPAVVAMVERWAQCMDPVGIPIKMSDSIAAVEELKSKVSSRVDPEVPTPRERAVAIAVARCNQQADWDGTIARETADFQLTEIGKHMGAFAAERDALAEYQKRLEAAVAEFGP